VRPGGALLARFRTMTPLILRRDEPSRNPPPGEAPDPNDPIETPRGADPAPGPEEPSPPERETTPILEG
jgi:hypothetical protein